MFDVKKSSNPKIYIEVLLLNFMSEVNKNESSIVQNKTVDERKNLSDNFVMDNKKTFTKDVEKVDNIVSVEENITEKVDNHIDQNPSGTLDNSDIFIPSIINLDEILSVRINNAFALANKQILNEEVENLNKLNDYTFDQQIGYLVCEILNSKFRVASEDIVVISYEYDSIVQQNLEHLEQMEEVYYKITNSSKKFAIITDEKWNELKSDYISHMKKGEHYEILPEPEKQFKKEESNDIITNDVASLFGDIVEID